MIRSARAWMPVFRNLGLTSLQLSMRVREAGFRRYSAKPEHVSPHYNRHWYRHILVAFSPGGRIPLPFQVWLGFPDGILIICYHMGMMRDMLVSSCSPDWGHVERFATDLDLKLDEDTGLLTEKLFLGLKLIARGGTGRELTSQSPLRVSLILRPCVLGRIGKTNYQSFINMV